MSDKSYGCRDRSVLLFGKLIRKELARRHSRIEREHVGKYLLSNRFHLPSSFLSAVKSEALKRIWHSKLTEILQIHRIKELHRYGFSNKCVRLVGSAKIVECRRGTSTFDTTVIATKMIQILLIISFLHRSASVKLLIVSRERKSSERDDRTCDD